MPVKSRNFAARSVGLQMDLPVLPLDTRQTIPHISVPIAPWDITLLKESDAYTSQRGRRLGACTPHLPKVVRPYILGLEDLSEGVLKMSRSRSKSFIQRIIEKALRPSATAGKNPPEYSTSHLPKAIAYDTTALQSTGGHTIRHLATRDLSPKEPFNLDKFIRENESWAPPSPREVLARRLLREAQQASNLKPRKSLSQSSGDYLIRRSLKGEHVV
ncbi:hypothetical protein RHS01_02145 [Rhizoctonia solani]|uniref:Uncharacterized protein n=1 Tax=Rhizoctonia solani TaxID=456999 RepID=A0A8H7IH78_9AGAM|nr:hypothetical protein RHS01_02145 [Rhizoctonia solani]